MSLCVHVCEYVCQEGCLKRRLTSNGRHMFASRCKYPITSFSTFCSWTSKKGTSSWAPLFHLPIYMKSKILASVCYRDLPWQAATHPLLHSIADLWQVKIMRSGFSAWTFWSPFGPAARSSEASKLVVVWRGLFQITPKWSTGVLDTSKSSCKSHFENFDKCEFLSSRRYLALY